ncbi:MAG: amino acid ABC transporter substrate-binding protein [Actinomycetes bacterium]
MGRIRTAAVLALVLVAVAAGCGEGDSGGASGPIKIGISLPLTGEFSEPGRAAKRGYETWEKITNDSGGVLGRKVELVIRDDASKQNTVVSDYNALISRERVDLLLGTFSSLLNLPASAVAERNRMVFVEPAGGAPELFERKFKYLFFSQQAVSDHQGDLFVEHLLSLPPDERPKTAAYPCVNDPFALPVLASIRERLEAAGVETVYKSTYPVDTTNFDSIANAVKAAEPDLVVNGAVFTDGVGFVRALNKVAYEPAFLFQTSAPSHGEQYADGVGVENTEGTFYAVSHTPEASTPGNKKFVDTYGEMFGGEPAEDAADAYASAQVLQTAVEEVGSLENQEKLANWLHAHQVQTILGPLRWDDLGRPQGEFMIGQWQDGKAEVILPEEVATTDRVVERVSTP